MAHIGMVFCDPDNVILVPNPGYGMSDERNPRESERRILYD